MESRLKDKRDQGTIGPAGTSYGAMGTREISAIESGGGEGGSAPAARLSCAATRLVLVMSNASKSAGAPPTKLTRRNDLGQIA